MEYKALIGLEMHCEISETKTKMFSSAENSFKETPNTNVLPVDMAFPGTLPVVNKEAVRKAIMASLILGCKQPEYMYFERKNYYYPDLPKGYQITQETKPAPVGIYGEMEYVCDGEIRVAKINNIHLEEDAASTEHHSSYSSIDYNRAGVPLLELVTEPCFHSANEAVSFLETMRSVYQYAKISEADSKKGQIRCDVNVSIMDKDKDETNPQNWGTKIEIKNINSFGGVRDAINYEIKRQIEAKENGKYDEMEQQTRRFDEETGTTIFMRSKVDAIDYKYFIDPNIPKFKISKDWIETIKKSIPKLPMERKKTYINKLGLSNYDADILVGDKNISDYFDATVEAGSEPKYASNWITSVILGYLNKYELNINNIYISPKKLTDLIKLVTEGKISGKQGKEILYQALTEKKDPVKIVEESGVSQIVDDKEIRKIVNDVIDEQADIAAEYRSGKDKVLDFLVGQVMKKTKGKANPTLAYNLMKEEISKR